MKKLFIIVFLTLTLVYLFSSGKVVAQSSHVKYRGMYFQPELNIGFGLQGELQPNEIGFAGLNATVGNWFSKKVTGGAGIGIQAFNGSNTVPLYLQGGYYFDEWGLGNLRFFARADAGLLFKLNGEVAPTRVFGNPSVGLLIPVARRRMVSFSLGFYSQWENKQSFDINQNDFNNFLNLKIGMLFF